MEKPSNARTVRCPRCGAPAVFSSENPARPFCSERCRLLDLGEWANEAYRMPIADHPPFFSGGEEESD